MLNQPELDALLRARRVRIGEPTGETWPQALCFDEPTAHELRIEFSEDDEHATTAIAGRLAALLADGMPCIVLAYSGQWEANRYEDARTNPLAGFLREMFLSYEGCAGLLLNPDEMALLGVLIQFALLYGWSVGEDVLVVGCNGDLLVWVGHDELVTVQARDRTARDRLIAAMSDCQAEFEITEG